LTAKLATHFARARAYDQATHFLRLAARRAERRRDHAAAAHNLARALSLVDHLPEGQRAGVRTAILAQRDALRRPRK
jgi:hypothetical protein